MHTLTSSYSPFDFVWASGIEDTFVPQARDGHRPLDEYELMGHYDHWREDLAVARDLGVSHLRWGIPWYRVEPKPGEFDWSWTDQVLTYLVQDLGITPIIDLMHYGCPFWLPREFAHRDYPHRVAAYAEAVATRYKGLVSLYTPLNEPLVNAMMCGRRGLWPPYLRGDQGYIRVILQLVRGIQYTVQALRSVDPDSVIVHVEATSISRAGNPSLGLLVDEDTQRGYLTFDLLTGRVTPSHPLFPWLVRHGAAVRELEDIARAPAPIDIMGLNFYPQWTTRELYLKSTGRLGYRIIERDGAGFESMLEKFYLRYGAPLMVTETSAVGSHWERSAWLDNSVAAVKRLRGRGVPVVGYTWFPLFTMIDWKYRFGQQPWDAYRLELGMYRLNQEPSGSRWLPSPLVEKYQHYIHNSHDAVGPYVTRVADAPLAGVLLDEGVGQPA